MDKIVSTVGGDLYISPKYTVDTRKNEFSHKSILHFSLKMRIITPS